MLRLLVSRSVNCGSTALQLLRSTSAGRCFHPTLVPCERHRSSPSKKKRQRRNRSKAKNKRRAHQESKISSQEWLPQEESQASVAFESLAKMTTEPLETLSSLPLELWSKSKADATFFHGRDGLTLHWSQPSVQTSQHPAVTAVLRGIESGTRTKTDEQVLNEEETGEVEDMKANWFIVSSLCFTMYYEKIVFGCQERKEVRLQPTRITTVPAKNDIMHYREQCYSWIMLSSTQISGTCLLVFHRNRWWNLLGVFDWVHEACVILWPFMYFMIIDSRHNYEQQNAAKCGKEQHTVVQKWNSLRTCRVVRVPEQLCSTCFGASNRYIDRSSFGENACLGISGNSTRRASLSHGQSVWLQEARHWIHHSSPSSLFTGDRGPAIAAATFLG